MLRCDIDVTGLKIKKSKTSDFRVLGPLETAAPVPEFFAFFGELVQIVMRIKSGKYPQE